MLLRPAADPVRHVTDGRGPIMVVLDDSRAAAAAAQWAAELGASSGREVVAAHLVGETALVPSQVRRLPDATESPRRWLIDLGRTLDGMWQAPLRDLVSRCSFQTLGGRIPVIGMCDMAVDLDTPLIVVGRPQLHGFYGASFAAALVEMARDHNVTIVAIDPSASFGLVIAGFDCGPGGQSAVRVAASLTALGAGDAMVVTGVERVPQGLALTDAAVVRRLEEYRTCAQREAERAALDGVRCGSGVVTTRLTPSDGLIQAASDLEAGMVVLAARQTVPSGGYRTSDAVVRHAPCSVVVTPVGARTWTLGRRPEA